jgi:hypothetical protein
MRRLFLAGLFSTTLGLFAGCQSGDGLPRQRITGKVTLGGKAVDAGTIQFMPLNSSGNALGGGAMIKDGSYEIPRDQGLVAGTYRVNIFSPDVPAGTDAGASAPPGESQDKPAKERVPERYNAKSTLKAQVTDDGQNVFNFDLEPK